jgi:hypothetical protein
MASRRVDGDDCVVLAQQSDEPAGGFARRVCQRVEALMREGRRVGTAVLGAGEGDDETATAARGAAARALGAAVGTAGGGLLEIVTASAPGAPFGNAVLALADELMQTLPVTTRLCIRRSEPAADFGPVGALRKAVRRRHQRSRRSAEPS